MTRSKLKEVVEKGVVSTSPAFPAALFPYPKGIDCWVLKEERSVLLKVCFYMIYSQK